MGLASDGFNPFSNMTSTYSLWPVILIPYNLPPWALMNRTNYFMSLLIPGPKSPGKDYDVFLKPLIDELNELWVGVEAYDVISREMFNLQDVIMWTINDFPAYAYLSGWSTSGKLACPICLEDTRSKRIRGKQCFMGHRCYLSRNSSWRKSKEYDGSREYRDPPREFSGDDILQQLSVTFNADCRQPVCVNAERFNNEIGFIVRTHGTFHYKEWRLVPEAVRAPLREFLLVRKII